MAAFTSQSLSFGDDIVVTRPLNSSFMSVVAKYDLNLHIQMIHQLPADVAVFAISANARGHYALVGGIFENVAFEGLETSPDRTSFVALYNKVGINIYARQLFSTNPISFLVGIYRTFLDEHSNCYFSGVFSGDVTLGGVQLDNRDTTLYNSYIGKLNPSGDTVYFTGTNNAGPPQTLHMVLGQVALPSGESYLTGLFQFNMKIGDLEEEDDVFRDFLLKLDRDGNPEYIMRSTGALTIGRSVVADQLGNIVYLGEFGIGEAFFGQLHRTTTSFNAQFIVKVSEDGTGPLCAQCPSTMSCCAAGDRIRCYDPSVHTCTAKHRLCPIGDESCGEACYAPSKYVCVNGGTLCPVEASGLCGGVCFNPTFFKCVNNRVVPINTA